MRKTLQKLLLAVPWQDSIRKRKYRLYVQAQEIQTEDDKVWFRAVIYDGGKAYLAVYCNREDYEFYTYKVQDKKWSEAVITHLDSRLYYGHDYGYVDRESQTVGSEYFGSAIADIATIPAMRRWQLGQKEYIFRQRFEQNQRRTRELMEQLKPLPKDIERYVTNVVMKEYRYLYYSRVKGRTLDCFCSHCREHMTVEQPKRIKGQLINQQMTCPHCGSRVTMKSQARAPWMRDTERFSYLERVADGVMIRNFEVAWNFSKDYREPPSKYMYEDSRVFLAPGSKPMYYEYKSKYTRTGRIPAEWVKVAGEYKTGGIMWNTYSPYRDAHIYPSNLRRTLRNTPWQYSALELWARRKKGNAEEYLTAYERYPCLEYVVKLGMYNLADSLVQGEQWIANHNGKNVMEIIGVSKQDLRALQKLNITVKELYFWRYCTSNGYAVDEEDIRAIRGLRGQKARRWLVENDLQELRDAVKFVPLKRCLSYMRRQCEKEPDYTLREWTDYLETAQKLGRDMTSEFVLFPPDLKKAHDEIMRLYEVKKNEATDRLIAEVYNREIKRYGYRGKQYFVTMPNGMDDLIAEGDALHHCVKTYAERVAAGKCIILFVRDISEPGKPFYTAEVRDGVMWQLRGLHNCAATDEVKAFWEKYEKQVLQPIKQQMMKGAA